MMRGEKREKKRGWRDGGQPEKERLELSAQFIYGQYRKGVDYLNRFNLYAKTEEAYRMFEGDQWYGLESGAERLPFYNFIQTVVEYKVGTVASNNMVISYAPMAGAGRKEAEYEAACDLLSRYAARLWELLKMESRGWEQLEDACIGGSSYLYFTVNRKTESGGDEKKEAPVLEMRAQAVDAVSIYFANEQNANIQEQPYIIIAERRPVTEIRREARAFGLPEDEIQAIVSDSDTEYILGETAKEEIRDRETGKCLSLLKMWKEKGEVCFCRATKNVIYQPMQKISGLKLYPIAGLVWLKRKNSARGTGEVMPLVPNQIEINKNLARRAMNAKISAFPRLVYDARMVSNPADLETVGSTVEVDGNVRQIQDAISYLQPASMSGDVKLLSDEMMNITRDLAGAGDAALGQINPEKASGAAIIAVRDQAALPLNKQVQAYRQFVEDVAAVWYALWAAYYTNGLPVELTDEKGGKIAETISGETLRQMKVNIRIDVSPATPITKWAQEQALENLFGKGELSFEEYVEALDETSSVPKARLMRIIEKRKLKAAEQQQAGQGQALAQAPGMPAGGPPALPAGMDLADGMEIKPGMM